MSEQRADMDQLRQENERLREENRILRKQIEANKKHEKRRMQLYAAMHGHGNVNELNGRGRLLP